MPRLKLKHEPFLDYAAVQHLMKVEGHFMNVMERSLAELEQMRAAGGVDVLAESLQRDVYAEIDRIYAQLRSAYLLTNHAAASLAHEMEHPRAAAVRPTCRQTRHPVPCFMPDRAAPTQRTLAPLHR